MRPLVRAAALAVAASTALAACGGGGDDAAGDAGRALAQGWNPVSGMACADGTPTGIGVSLGTRNSVLVVLSGGGACWSETTCAGISRGPFGATEYFVYSAFARDTILDRNLPGNPFADWTMVFVPYCTGDVHAGGDVARTYGGVSWRHRGRANLAAAVARVAEAMPSPERVVVSGFSAGGFGALLGFDLARTRWPAGAGAAKVYLVDDSGPTFVGDDLPAAIRTAWWSAWSLDATIGPLCPACQDDLSALWTVLRASHPGDRLALLTTTRDGTMSGYFGLDAAAFEAGVTNLAAKLGAIPGVATFRVSGTGHAMLVQPASYAAGATPLVGWLAQQVSDAAGWTSAGP